VSNITTIYNQIIAKLATTFPTKTRIPYPYSLEDNNKNLLADGYGLIIGGADYEDHEFCNYMISRSISVVFTKEVFRTDSDAVVVDDIVKALSEDVKLTQDLFYAYSELDIDVNIAKVDITSVSGVEEVVSGKQSILAMTANFNFYIKESL
jgi:hypothetical protein